MNKLNLALLSILICSNIFGSTPTEEHSAQPEVLELPLQEMRFMTISGGVPVSLNFDELMYQTPENALRELDFEFSLFLKQNNLNPKKFVSPNPYARIVALFSLYRERLLSLIQRRANENLQGLLAFEKTITKGKSRSLTVKEEEYLNNFKKTSLWLTQFETLVLSQAFFEYNTGLFLIETLEEQFKFQNVSSPEKWAYAYATIAEQIGNVIRDQDVKTALFTIINQKNASRQL